MGFTCHVNTCIGDRPAYHTTHRAGTLGGSNPACDTTLFLVSREVIEGTCRWIRPCVNDKSNDSGGGLGRCVTLHDICAAWAVASETGWAGLRNRAGRLYAQQKHNYDRDTRRRLLWLRHAFQKLQSAQT
jgi:hypothetical protein